MDTPKTTPRNALELQESDLQAEPNKLDSTARLKLKRVLAGVGTAVRPTMGSLQCFFQRKVKIIESRVLSNEIGQFQIEFVDEPNDHGAAPKEAKGEKKWIGDWMLKRMVPIEE